MNTEFTGALIEVGWMPGNEALAIFPEWAFAPIAGVVHTRNLAQVQARYLSGVAFVVVPHTFAAFVSSVVPMIQIKHFGLSAAGERELGVIPYLVAEPHVADVGLHLVKLDASISQVSVPSSRFRWQISAVAKVWESALAHGLAVMKPVGKADMRGVLLRFNQGWQAEDFCVLKNVAGAAQMVTVGYAVTVSDPGADAAAAAAVAAAGAQAGAVAAAAVAAGVVGGSAQAPA